MSWMDTLILIVLAISGLNGWQRGLILTVFQMGAFIVAGMVAKAYHPMVSAYILDHPQWFVGLQKIVSHRVETVATQEASTMGGGQGSNIFELLKFPRGVADLFMQNSMMRDYSAKAMEGVQSYVADALTRMFIDWMSILLIFILVKILLMFIAHILNGVASLPILNGINRMAGLSVGVVKGLLMVLIFLALLTPIATMTDQGILLEGLEASRLARFLYDHNFLVILLQRLVKL